MKTIASKAPYGRHGMGQHFAQIVEEARERDLLRRYYTSRIRVGDERVGRVVPARLRKALLRFTPVRFSTGWQTYLDNDLFDRGVASVLEDPVSTYAGFSGQSLRSFQRARSLGAQLLELHSPTIHVLHVKEKYAAAMRQYGIEASWLNEWSVRKMVEEYAEASIIYINSDYACRSFLDRGVPQQKLRRIDLKAHPRYQIGPCLLKDDVFRVVYVGSLTVTKGIPVLLEAFSRFAVECAELTLVGSWSTRGMRRYIQSWMRRDPRIRLAPGDPLDMLRRADAYVHPTYQDGFGYAPMEALMCGVPVIVTEDTGMKEHVREGENGYIVPTGSWRAILERLEYLYTHGLNAEGTSLMLRSQH